MITNVHLENFRSFENTTISLGLRNLLVGPNMSGKSNFISVFRFFTDIVSGGPGLFGLSKAMSNGFAELAWRGGDANLMSIVLQGDFREFNELGRNENWRYELHVIGDRSRDSFIVNDESLHIADCALVKKDPATGARILQSKSGESVTSVSDAHRSALEFELPDWEGNRLRKLFASFRFYSLVPQIMRQINPASAPTSLDMQGGNLSAWLMLLQTRYPEIFARMNKAAKDALPELERILAFVTPRSVVFTASSERFLKSDVPIWQMSDGELCFLALLSLIFIPDEISGTLFCIEEPENYLHPALIGELIGLLEQRQIEFGEKAVQTIITTHSPLVVDKFKLEDVIVFERQRGASICTRPGDKPQLRELLEREEVGLGDIVYSGALSREN
ncbi:MAG: AAA family ATPase [Acidobacteriia bacterium]|nr:AAA family ATPase [Terriglobia bacterium]